MLEPASLCSSCWSDLTHIDDPVCAVMGTPFAFDEGEGTLSAAAIANPPAWDRAKSAVAFDDASRRFVHGLKYRDQHEMALLMARMMARAGRRLLTEADAILPVPLHRFRLWRRRFNQSALLAERLAALSGKRSLPLVLERAKATPPQVGLDGEARRKNLKGAFQVKPEQLSNVAGKRLLLVDDVLTTGATAEACAIALKNAGAARVDVLTFALVLAQQRLHI